MRDLSVAAQRISADGVEALNGDCFCLSLDEAALQRALESELGTCSRTTAT